MDNVATAPSNVPRRTPPEQMSPAFPVPINNQQFPNKRVSNGPTSSVDIPSPPSLLRPLHPPHNLTSYIRPQSVYRSPGPHPSSYPHSQPYTEHRGHPLTNTPVHPQDRLVPDVQSVHTELQVPSPIRSQGPAPNVPIHIDHHPVPGPRARGFSAPIRHPIHAATPPPGPPPYHPGPAPDPRLNPHSVRPVVSIEHIPSPARPAPPPPHRISEKAPLVDVVEDLSDDDASVVSSCVEDSQSDVVEYGDPGTLFHLELLNISDRFLGKDSEITVANQRITTTHSNNFLTSSPKPRLMFSSVTGM